ncbi:hypothetical protein SHKM778_22550 [Streptomyces sp. KM77-8]|uniref:Large helicase-related protein winged-helix domain-containing protein n=1 Tax=Streptomyces haneummycinicus TaxID=3074435 RepID=A0AAT9HER4_9ACTN
MRALLGSGRTAGATAHRAKRSVPRGRYGALTAAARGTSRTGPPTVGGRWSLLPGQESDATVRAHALSRALLDRHGVVTRGAVSAEGVEGGFSAVYRVLAAFEETGQARRGYVVEGLGAAQFAMDGAVDRLRAAANARERGDGLPDPVPAAQHAGMFDPFDPVETGRDEAPQSPPPWQHGGRPTYDPFAGRRTGADRVARAVVLAAADPANAYGAALGWPEPPTGAGHKPGRKAGSLVVLVDGELTLYMERGGKTLLAWPADADGEPAEDPGSRPPPRPSPPPSARARSARSRWSASTAPPP